MKPKVIVILRHAESLEDVDDNAYSLISDKDMPLTDKGVRQAEVIGKELRYLFSNTSAASFILTPITRVIQTAETIIKEFEPKIHCSVIADPLLMKQNWGSITVTNKLEIDRERYEAGVLRYHFRDGESGPELLARFALFIKNFWTRVEDPSFPDLAVFITNGFGMRLLLMTIFNWSEEYFENLAHPKHCEFKTLELQSDDTYKLREGMRIVDHTSNPNFVRRKT